MMEKVELHVLHSNKTVLQEHVDPLKITQKLFKLKVLNDIQKKDIFTLSRDSREKTWRHLLPLLERKCCFQQLLQVLLECSYTELFLQLAIQWQCLLKDSRQDVVAVQRTGSSRSSSRFSQNLFIELKIKTHNINFGNPRTDIHDHTQFYKIQYLNETNEFERMTAADKYAACLCAEIDAHTMLYVRKFPTHGLFDELREIIPHTSNTHVTQVAHDSRISIAHAIADQDDKGEEFLRSAMTSSVYVGYCVELVNMLYIYVFNLICIYEKKPIRRTLDKIMNIAEFSLQCLQEEDDDIIRCFWTRMFYLRMVYCLLGISNKGDIIPGCIVLQKHLAKAKELLIEVDKIWHGIESRRQMFYYVAQARIAELDNTQAEIDLAIEYINMAIEIGSKGNFGETAFIRGYYTDLEDKRTRLYLDDEIENASCKTEKYDRAVEHDETTEYVYPSTSIKYVDDEKDSTQTSLKETKNCKTLKPKLLDGHINEDPVVSFYSFEKKTETTQQGTKELHQQCTEKSQDESKFFQERLESLLASNVRLNSMEQVLSIINLHRP